MRKLNRGLASMPDCLNHLSHETSSWDNVNTKKKRKIWAQLDKFQDRLCVYCESNAFRGELTGHIEHFYDRKNFSHLTFEWTNLFGCCASNSHCGHYKDQELPGGTRRTYDHVLLIKPDEDDPEEYLKFLPTGEIVGKEGISEAMKQRAVETIRALYLDSPRLNKLREEQINRFEDKVTAVYELLDAGEEVDSVDAMNEYYQIEQDALNAEYRTALKHAVNWL